MLLEKNEESLDNTLFRLSASIEQLILLTELSINIFAVGCNRDTKSRLLSMDVMGFAKSINEALKQAENIYKDDPVGALNNLFTARASLVKIYSKINVKKNSK